MLKKNGPCTRKRESVILTSLLFVHYSMMLNSLWLRKKPNIFLTKGRAVSCSLSKAGFPHAVDTETGGGQAPGCFADHILPHTGPTEAGISFWMDEWASHWSIDWSIQVNPGIKRNGCLFTSLLPYCYTECTPQLTKIKVQRCLSLARVCTLAGVVSHCLGLTQCSVMLYTTTAHCRRPRRKHGQLTLTTALLATR